MTDNRIPALSNWVSQIFNVLDPQLDTVCGDASFRKYYRVQINDRSVIVVDSPKESQKNYEFVFYAKLLLQAEITVPEVIAVDYNQGFMCLSDLGDKLLFDQLTEENLQTWYKKALCLLPKLHLVDAIMAKLPKFDAAFIQIENTIFSEWLLDSHLQLKLDEPQQQVLDTVFQALIDNSLAQPQVSMHRDFHSRNIMLQDSDNLAVIDFQDMVLGPITYDSVSLLRDCYCRWPDAQIEQLKQQYFEMLQLDEIPYFQFSRWFDLTGMQRHIKAAGIFARLWHRDGKDGYLADIPRTLDYIIDIGSLYPEFKAFVLLIKEIKQQLLSVSKTRNRS